jgi:hypothetical protein
MKVMDKKVISFKGALYEKQYREFFKKPENRNLSKSVFLKCDVRIEKSNKIS